MNSNKNSDRSIKTPVIVLIAASSLGLFVTYYNSSRNVDINQENPSVEISSISNNYPIQIVEKPLAVPIPSKNSLDSRLAQKIDGLRKLGLASKLFDNNPDKIMSYPNAPKDIRYKYGEVDLAIRVNEGEIPVNYFSLEGIGPDPRLQSGLTIIREKEQVEKLPDFNSISNSAFNCLSLFGNGIYDKNAVLYEASYLGDPSNFTGDYNFKFGPRLQEGVKPIMIPNLDVRVARVTITKTEDGKSFYLRNLGISTQPNTWNEAMRFKSENVENGPRMIYKAPEKENAIRRSP